jgi:hypothetical protein
MGLPLKVESDSLKGDGGLPDALRLLHWRHAHEVASGDAEGNGADAGP